MTTLASHVKVVLLALTSSYNAEPIGHVSSTINEAGILIVTLRIGPICTHDMSGMLCGANARLVCYSLNEQLTDTDQVTTHATNLCFKPYCTTVTNQ